MQILKILNKMNDEGWTLRGTFPCIKMFSPKEKIQFTLESGLGQYTLWYGYLQERIKIIEENDITNLPLILNQILERFEEIRSNKKEIENKLKDITKNTPIGEARKMIDLNRIEFSYFLSISNKFRRRIATLNYTKRRNQFLWVPSRTGGVYVSHISPLE